MNILYLDFDGVMHDSEVWWSPERGAYLDVPGRTLFEWAPILQTLLSPYPAISIVLSTSWVHKVGFVKSKSLLPPELAVKVIGATFDEEKTHPREFQMLTRAEQILLDVTYRQPTSWFAIDDDAFKWPEVYRGRLVKTLGAYGVSHPRAQDEIRRLLVQMFASR